MQEAVLLVLWGVGFLNHTLLSRSNQSSALCEKSKSALGQLLGAKDLSLEFFECSPQDHEMDWPAVKDTWLATTMQDLYDFAYKGEFDLKYYPGELGDETRAFWITNILIDLARSSYLNMFSEYSGRGEFLAAARLLQICETAHARHVLEGADESFFPEADASRLTIRHMALLSGMTEESLRAMANPKRSNPLPTQSEDRSTFVSPEDARAWLKSKGRYLPLRAKVIEDRLLDLRSRTFHSRDDVLAALDAHLGVLASMGPSFEEVRTALKAAEPHAFREHSPDKPKEAAVWLALENDILDDEARVRRLGEALGLDSELLVLKVQDVIARERVRQIAMQIEAKVGKR